jgi:hypothetical protein
MFGWLLCLVGLVFVWFVCCFGCFVLVVGVCCGGGCRCGGGFCWWVVCCV